MTTHMGDIGLVLVIDRCIECDPNNLGVVHGRVGIGGERQCLLTHACCDKLGQPRLVQRRFAVLQIAHNLRVGV